MILFGNQDEDSVNISGLAAMPWVAQGAYETAEKNTESDPNVQVVLVSVENLDALRKAYPNYYVDTRDFIAAIKKEIK